MDELFYTSTIHPGLRNDRLFYMKPTTVTTSGTVLRQGEDLPVTFSGTYVPGYRGDRETPDEPPTFEDVTAKDQEHNTIDLTDDEVDEAITALLNQLAADNE